MKKKHSAFKEASFQKDLWKEKAGVFFPFPPLLWILVTLLLEISLFTTLVSMNQARAEELAYIQPPSTALKATPQMGASNIMTLERGQEVQILKVEGTWSQIQYKDKIGWVSKIFITKTKPVGAAELSKKGQTEAQVSRKRAPSYAVSAATRGLQANDRVRDGRELYRSDRKAVEEMEKLNITDKQIKNFNAPHHE